MIFLPTIDIYGRFRRRRIEFGYLPGEERGFSEALRLQFPDIRYAAVNLGGFDDPTHRPELDFVDHPDQVSRPMVMMVFVPPGWKPDWQFTRGYPSDSPRWYLVNVPWPRGETGHPAIGVGTPESGWPDLRAERRIRAGGVENLPRLEMSQAFEVTLYWHPDLPEARRKALAVLRAMERMTTRKVLEVRTVPTLSWSQTERSKIRCSPASLAWAAAAPMRLAGEFMGTGHLPYDCDPTKLGFVEGW